MNLIAPSILVGILVAVVAAPSRSGSPDDGAPAHVRNSFEFTVQAPQSRIAPLFGADRERWAAGWDPQFIYPQPPVDEAGVVFTVQHGNRRSTWITTIYEPEQGHIQHVYFIPDAMVTLIDIRLSQPGPSTTHVSVTYERTALSAGLNEHVRHQGESDAASGPRWKQEIETFLAKTK